MRDRGGLFASLLRHSGTYSVLGVFSRILSFALVPVYTRYLSTADYGILELLELTSCYIVALVGSRLADAVAYYYHSTAEKKRVVSTSFLAMAGAGAAIWIAGTVFARDMSLLVFRQPDQAPLFRVIFISLALLLPTDLGLFYIRLQNRSGLYTALQLGRVALMAGLNVLFLVWFHLGLRSILYSTVIATGLMSGIVGVYILKHCGWGFDRALFRRQVRFAAPLVISTVGMITIHYGDRFFLQRSASMSDVGIYALAYKIGMLVSSFALPFGMYWHTQMYDFMKRGGEGSYARLGTYLVLVYVTLGLGISVFARPAVTAMAAPAFHSAAVYVPLIAAAYVLLNASEFFRSILLIEKRPSVEGRVMLVGTVSCVVFYGLLIPWLKIWGAAAATMLTVSVLGVYGFRQAQRVRRIRFETGRIAKIAASAGLAYGIHVLLPASGWKYDVLNGFGCLALFAGVLIGTGFVLPEERRYLAAAFSRRPAILAGSN